MSKRVRGSSRPVLGLLMLGLLVPGLLMPGLLMLGGCALGTGVVPVGPGVYAISALRAPVRGGGPEARRVVLATATGFCQQQGRALVLLDLRPDGDPFTPYWPTAFDATFRCGAAADAALPPVPAATARRP